MIKLTYAQYNSLHDCTTKENVKFALHGVYFDKQDIVACNVVSMAVVTTEEPVHESLTDRIFVLPRRAKKSESVRISGKIITFYNEKRMTQEEAHMVEVEDGIFPKWRTFMPKKEAYKYRISFDPKYCNKYYNAHTFYFTRHETPMRVLLSDEEGVYDPQIQMVIMPCRTGELTPWYPIEYDTLYEENAKLRKRIAELEATKQEQVYACSEER